MPITTVSLLWQSNIWCGEEFPEILNANPSALVENIICYHLFDKTLLVKSGWGRCTLFNHPTLSVETQHDTFQAKWTWSLTQLLNMFDSSNHSNYNTVYQLAPPWIPGYALHTSKGHQIHCLLLSTVYIQGCLLRFFAENNFLSPRNNCPNKYLCFPSYKYIIGYNVLSSWGGTRLIVCGNTDIMAI